MAEVMNDGNTLPKGIALKRAPDVSPDQMKQTQYAHYGYYPSSASAAAAMIAAGVQTPTYKSVIENQLFGEMQSKTKAGTAESKVLMPSRRRTPSAGSAKMEKKPVPARVEKVKRQLQEGVGHCPQPIVNLLSRSTYTQRHRGARKSL